MRLAIWGDGIFSHSTFRGNPHSKQAVKQSGLLGRMLPTPTLGEWGGMCRLGASISSPEPKWRDGAPVPTSPGAGSSYRRQELLLISTKNLDPKCEAWQGFPRPSVQVLPCAVGETEAQRDGKGLCEGHVVREQENQEGAEERAGEVVGPSV